MVKKIYFFFKTYFGFTNRESRGFVLLLPIIVILYAIPIVYEKIFLREDPLDLVNFHAQLDSLEKSGWMKIGSMPTYQNYISDTSRKNSSNRRQEVYKKLSFDEADSIVLQIVPGVGQTMAGRIIKFRDGLGGMHSMDQLLDVFGMTPEVSERIFDYFEFIPGVKKKIDINTSDVQLLATHPYINYGSAKVIVAYRDQHGPYTSAEDLFKVRIFTEEWVNKIKPYLTF
ncbi:DNA uptake protein ComE [Belliella buryatensis]|uniref:DNA uptake protein ComE n=1 Tax=Belliella buryatensis TaxID=1500549 RepID=A0A239F504_9BACT|nr:helix-hairpin-helix domain-containing protein [Belliella buryatensis]SNS51821.1 DNA uptake protein ComE [Belliella buryatensis]